MSYTHVDCPACGQSLTVNAEAAERMTKCPACGSVLRMAAAADDAAPVAATPGTPPPEAAPEPNPPTTAEAVPPPAPEAAPAAETPPAPDASPAPEGGKKHVRLTFRTGRMDAPASDEKPAAAAGAPASDPGEPRLRLNRTGALGGEFQLCTECNAIQNAGDVVCSQCGFNSATGRYMQAEHARRERIRRLLSTLAVLAILAGLGAAAWSRGLLRLPDRWPRFRIAPAEPSGPAAPAEPAAPAAPAPKTEAEIALLTEAIANSLRARLDERLPMKERNDPVELVMLDGRVVSGFYRGLKPGGIALVHVDDVLQEVRLDQLREESRLVLDGDFRTESLRARARQQAESGRLE